MPSSLSRRSPLARGAALIAIAVAALTVVILSTAGGTSHRTVPTGSPPASATTPVLREPRLFAPTSIWNSPIPANAQVDPSSPPLISALSTEVSNELQAGIGPWTATAKASTPIYIVGRHQPTVRVLLDDPTLWWRVTLQRAFEAVPIPADAQPARGNDAHMTVWQPSRDKLWEFFKMRKESDGWHAAWGGAIRNVSRSPGYYTSTSWPGALPQWGATATSLPVAAGVIRIPEFRAGLIDHALALNLPAPRAGVVAAPAERSDGTGGPDTIPEGAQLRLDPNLDLSRLSLPPVTRMIAEAAQRYGMIVRDQTHYGISLFGEDPTQYGGKQVYYGEHGIFGELTPEQILAKFPWSHLQVLKLRLSPYRLGHV